MPPPVSVISQRDFGWVLIILPWKTGWLGLALLHLLSAVDTSTLPRGNDILPKGC
ncbi:uncharacterized protein METZ01_LOCUS79414 [marine metagenome]|uniref:Uncharacterized protein n=1 Tax=marine metagenome TaxID=408172 RepID=A0A381UEJ8_9ZZZZ